MTDNDTIKALECCIESDCDNCPWHEQTACNEYMKQDALDLINRQKSEIERLNNHIQEGIELAKQIPEMIALAQAEAVKEFAERFEAYIPNIEGETTMECVKNAIKQTLKEMAGENND